MPRNLVDTSMPRCSGESGESGDSGDGMKYAQSVEEVKRWWRQQLLEHSGEDSD